MQQGLVNEESYKRQYDKDKVNHKIISNAIRCWSDTSTENERSINSNISCESK
jgi:hypothetical protein